MRLVLDFQIWVRTFYLYVFRLFMQHALLLRQHLKEVAKKIDRHVKSSGNIWTVVSSNTFLDISNALGGATVGTVSLFKCYLFFLHLSFFKTTCFEHWLPHDHVLCPVPYGGLLWETFLLVMGPDKMTQTLTDAYESSNKLPVRVNNQLWSMYQRKYIGWLAIHFASMGRRGNQILTQLTMVVKYLGLSHSGIDMLSSHGLLMSGRTTTRRTEAEVNRFSNIVRSIQTIFYLKNVSIYAYDSICVKTSFFLQGFGRPKTSSSSMDW